jgi:hypothetical protein
VEPPECDRREGCAALGGRSTLSFPRASTYREKCNGMPEVGCRGFLCHFTVVLL